MGDGRGDFQAAWHSFAGAMFDGVHVLDVGAGLGLSRDRLACGGRNRVTAHDIDRSLMDRVDLIAELRDVSGLWDIVTGFDVVEHAANPDAFVSECGRLARCGVLLTTPSARLYPHPWHFDAARFLALFERMLPGWTHVYLGRFKAGESDEVRMMSLNAFTNDPAIYALGIYARRP